MNSLKKKYKRRTAYILSIVATAMVGLSIVLYLFNDNIIFFYTPSELLSLEKANISTVRIGGIVAPGSLKKTKSGITFVIMDKDNKILAQYDGIVPSLFKEGQATVALGEFDQEGKFIAKEILAKHDENYVPKSRKTKYSKIQE